MKFGRPLAIIVHYTDKIQFRSVANAVVPDMGPYTILKIKKKH